MLQSRHARRIAFVWAIVTAALLLVEVLFLPLHFPPGRESDAAAGQVLDNTVLTITITPFLTLVLVYLVYAVVVFGRQRSGEEDGPVTRGHVTVQTAWVAVTLVTVLWLAAYGTYRLFPSGSGGGQGPEPLAVPSGDVLPVQVIGQQWQFTYRYLSYGGLETPQLVLPVGRDVEFRVTSLDVVHAFWPYELAVKADAVPGVVNVAYARVQEAGTFHIRCAELCGLWHGYMFDTGRVVSEAEFASWIADQQRVFEPVSRYLPKVADSYSPAPTRRAG
jgi:cytochrome c oxidase subunit 2